MRRDPGCGTGKTSRDSCELLSNLPELQDVDSLTGLSPLFCAFDTPFLTQVKLLGSYTLTYDVQVSGTLQNLPGQQIAANVTYSSALLAPQLGRPLSESTVRPNVIDPGSVYGDRLMQLDVRATKIFSFGPTRVRAIFDVYNVFNDSTPLELNNQYGAVVGGGANWQRPNLIIPGRLVKFAFQLDF